MNRHIIHDNQFVSISMYLYFFEIIIVHRFHFLKIHYSILVAKLEYKSILYFGTMISYINYYRFHLKHFPTILLYRD